MNPPRVCPICRRPLERHYEESRENWRKRQTCGPTCAQALRNRLVEERRAGVPRAFPSGWPSITDPAQQSQPSNGFAAHELRFRPQPGRVSQPATQLATSSVLGEG